MRKSLAEVSSGGGGGARGLISVLSLPLYPYFVNTCEQRTLWRVCAYAQTRTRLRCSTLRKEPISHALVDMDMDIVSTHMSKMM